MITLYIIATVLLVAGVALRWVRKKLERHKNRDCFEEWD